MSNDRTYRPSSTRTKAVAAFYEKHPYPDPAPDLEAFRKGEGTLLGSPSHFSDLLWPGKASPSPLNILIAGCGTSQAAKYALLNPDAIVTGIDLSEASLAHTQRLADRYALRNLTIHRLPIEKAPELATRYDLIVSTGVLHHMPDPQVGLNALTTVLRDEGVMHLMVYARYGRTGVYMMQELCERLHVHPEDESIADLQRLSRSLPQTHPLNMFSPSHGRPAIRCWRCRRPYAPSRSSVYRTPNPNRADHRRAASRSMAAASTLSDPVCATRGATEVG